VHPPPKTPFFHRCRTYSSIRFRLKDRHHEREDRPPDHEHPGRVAERVSRAADPHAVYKGVPMMTPAFRSAKHTGASERFGARRVRRQKPYSPETRNTPTQPFQVVCSCNKSAAAMTVKAGDEPRMMG